ncbi:MAG TPA: ATP-grasp fold amidoligase family protein [Steroidobacteraceae bacterium]|nr:ATP-grasp fold amidoligase family protein [Steroidobacteraceae bacterium]
MLATALPRLKKSVLPRNRLGDNLYHRLLFLRKHRRAPGAQMLWNDVLYRLKTSKEIRAPLRVLISDKEGVKHYVRDTVGEEFNVPTIAVLRSPAEVDAFEFPARCCIKPTHASGHVILRRGGEPVDLSRIRAWFGLDYYRAGREVNYRGLQPKVIVEPLVFDRTNVEDFKVFCWQGVPKLIQQDFDRYIHHTRKFFDVEWNEQDFSIIYPRSTAPSPRPATLPVMLELARKLSAPFSFIRIDLYTDGRRVLVGEITNCSENAGGVFVPRSAEEKASRLLFGQG